MGAAVLRRYAEREKAAAQAKAYATCCAVAERKVDQYVGGAWGDWGGYWVWEEWRKA